MNKGFALIEMVVYIGLFSIVIGGGMVATYQIMESTNAGTSHVILQEEANFLLRKINWALTGAKIANPSGTTLNITKYDGTTYVFNLDSGNLMLNGTPLNSSSISVSELNFSSPGTNGVKTSFKLTTVQDGREASQTFSTTK